jgi:hypothetical protein
MSCLMERWLDRAMKYCLHSLFTDSANPIIDKYDLATRVASVDTQEGP